MRTIICPHCDMTSEIPTMRAEQVAQCSRCHQVICKQTYYTSSSMLALSICALLLLEYMISFLYFFFINFVLIKEKK
ncbi:hypothetical protein [Psychromonas sp. CD1]|uniref:hypothetical protein n=1 Tax=Psychromonas sp. CD1 TaxID=1979839 RepID=UPI00117AA64A|nr:hypothetical protein [Psychromonas sp. CD1]